MPPQNQTQGNTQQRDELLSAFTDRYCRFVPRYFGDAPEAVAVVEDLSAAFARTHDAARNRAALQLHHTALPKLSGVGVVDYDARSRTVRYYGHSQLEDVLYDPNAERSHAGEVR